MRGLLRFPLSCCQQPEQTAQRQERSSASLPNPAPAAAPAPAAEVIAPTGFDNVLDDMRSKGRAMPPALYIHMPRDEGMAGKVGESVRMPVDAGGWTDGAACRACPPASRTPAPPTLLLAIGHRHKQAQVAENLRILRQRKIPVGEIQVRVGGVLGGRGTGSRACSGRPWRRTHAHHASPPCWPAPRTAVCRCCRSR